MDQSNSDEVCSVCSEEVKGGFEVEEGNAPGVDFMIEIVRTPDNDHIVCDACNDVVHFRCLKHPCTGYCDRCFDKYGLEDVDCVLSASVRGRSKLEEVALCHPVMPVSDGLSS